MLKFFLLFSAQEVPAGMQNVPGLRLQEPGTVNYSTICYAETYMYSLFYRKETNIAYTPNIHLNKLKVCFFGTAHYCESPRVVKVQCSSLFSTPFFINNQKFKQLPQKSLIC